MEYNNKDVRRQDRLMDEQRAYALLRNGEYGFLAMTDAEGLAYGIPINYVWDGADAIYLHCAPTGRKLTCIAAHPEASFCVVGKTGVVSDKFTTAYESIVIRCRATIGLPAEERRAALRLLLEKYSPNDMEVGLKYAEKSFHRTKIIRLDLLTFSGKNKIIS